LGDPRGIDAEFAGEQRLVSATAQMGVDQSDEGQPERGAGPGAQRRSPPAGPVGPKAPERHPGQGRAQRLEGVAVDDLTAVRSGFQGIHSLLIKQ
jgi:hypothetical protein